MHHKAGISPLLLHVFFFSVEFQIITQYYWTWLNHPLWTARDNCNKAGFPPGTCLNEELQERTLNEDEVSQDADYLRTL